MLKGKVWEPLPCPESHDEGGRKEVIATKFTNFTEVMDNQNGSGLNLKSLPSYPQNSIKYRRDP